MTPQQILDFSYAYSRQGNIYAGDTQYSNGNLSPNGLVDSLYGHETNRLYRQSWGLTYNGLWDWGQSKAGVYYEKTNNTRLQEGATGRVEGMINSEDYATSRLESWRTTSELNVPFFWLADQTLTLGMEWNHDQLDDP
ncbi:TonB-dependent siderophore receptor, partial [Pseudomonas aeruginosa]|nr:TonB-dependent siderophore receptor [Pseudomonas aeruginosa]